MENLFYKLIIELYIYIYYYYYAFSFVKFHEKLTGGGFLYSWIHILRMKLGFFRKKRSQPRGPDGKFAAVDGIGDGVGTVPARGYARDLATLKETFTAAADLHNSITNAALERLEQQNRFQELQEMTDDLEGSIEDGGGDPFEAALLKFLPVILQGGLQPKPNSDPWGVNAGVATPSNISPPQEPQVRVTTPDQEKAQGVDRLNIVLKALSKLPLDKVNEGVVRKVAQTEGIDYEALQGTIRKLHPVVVKNG